MIAFNLECTKCDVSTSFDCEFARTIKEVEDLAQKKHRAVSPTCLGELVLYSQFITAIPAKDLR